MNKLTVIVALGLGLSMPLSAMAEDVEDVTIRVMEMSEQTKESVLQMIALPDQASDIAREKIKQAERNRVQERVNEDNDENEEMDKERERAMEEMRTELESEIEDRIQENEQTQESRPTPNAGR